MGHHATPPKSRSDCSMTNAVKFGNKKREDQVRVLEIERQRMMAIIIKRDEERRCMTGSQTARAPCANSTPSPTYCSLPEIKDCEYRFDQQRRTDGGWVMKESHGEKRQQLFPASGFNSGTDVPKKRFVAGRNESKMNPLIERDDEDEEFDPDLVQAAKRSAQRGGGIQTECDVAHGWHGSKKFIPHPPASITPEHVSFSMMHQPAVGFKFPVLAPAAPHPLRQHGNHNPGHYGSSPSHVPHLRMAGERLPMLTGR